mmetsp:Transcript_31606/g.66456  ORF Transcript_31606/g.66456 Transcript_31606/m.66456 type:complete len:670 (+) Transcript_31606:78-2087(+)
MKPRSKRNRKRPRGGIGCLVGDGGSDDIDVAKSASSLLRTEVVPLSRAFDIISETTRDEKQNGTIVDANNKQIIETRTRQMHNRRRVRIIQPYPFTFATFAKARWIGRTVVDIYHKEFGSYPRSYYEAAINAGRILVSGGRVDCEYLIKGGDELTHTVHRHEPAVGVADVALDDGNAGDHPPIQIVYEDDTLLVVDKPATLPIHPCGGYNFNSLFEILSHWKPDLYGSGKLFTVHRLDRLTSGLVLTAKTSASARSLGKCIMERDGCEKIYFARVKGKFPLGLKREGNESNHPWEFQYSPPDREKDLGGGENCPNKRPKCSILPPCEHGKVIESEAKAWNGGLRIPIMNSEGDKKNKIENSKGASESNTQLYAGLGYWMTDGQGTIVKNASLQDLIGQCEDASMEEMLAGSIGSAPNTGNSSIPTKESFLWLNFASPCRIASHKNGVCETGEFSELNNDDDRKGIKPAQTSFALLSYDASSDTSLVVAKPVTGRTHQIRLHLQKLGHPIANDHCYGGELWFGDEEGKEVCRKSREWLDRLDRGGTATANGRNNMQVTPENSTNADTPATDAEIYQAAANRPREDGESILDFIEKTCVWCARCRGVDKLGDSSKLDNEAAVFRRTLMEYLVRSQGIWLHALQYSLKVTEENGQSKTLSYRTDLPSWSTMM